MHRKICFIAQFPPPIHGLSKAVETLYHSRLNSRTDQNGKFDFEKVDVSDNRRFLISLFKISRSNADLFYFTISQTLGGNIRDLIILSLLRIQKKRCLIHLHGGYYRKLVDVDMPTWQRKLNYKLLENLAGAIVLSESLKDIFRGMISEDKIFVVENCLDDQYLLTEKEMNEKVDELSHKDIFHVLWLSNFIESKGYLTVLSLAKKEKERIDAGGKQQFFFDFAGQFFSQDEKKKFDTYVNKYNLSGLIKYYGIVDGERKRELLRQSDIFALPTRYPKEGQPISIIEAMGNGLAILTTNHAGISDIVEDGVNGVTLRETTNDEQAYNLLCSLDSLQIRTMCVVNYKNCVQKYTKEKYISGLEKIFNYLCNN